MTRDEKVNLMWISGCTSKDPTDGGVPRLGVPGYNWGTEDLHGAQSMCVDDACPTIFPVLAALGSSFNDTLWRAVGSAIATEMRVANNLHVGRTDCPNSGVGLNGWGPNVNLQRDPRWGRALEVPSEDPLLAGALGAAMVRGLQRGEGEGECEGECEGEGEGNGNGNGNGNGTSARYGKLLASIKHFTVYSMESSDGASRQGFDPTVSLRDMGESYLPAFRAAMRPESEGGGGALGAMCSYTALNGTAICESALWLTRWARNKTGFAGNVVTDCGALNMPGPEARSDVAHNAAAALNAGTDLNCGQPWAYKNLGDAIDKGLTSEAALDASVARSLALRVRAGMFDPVANQPFTRLGKEALGSAAHHALAYDAAAQGLVLLQNAPLGGSGGGDGGGGGGGSGAGGAAAVLPLSPALRTAVIGPHANATRSLLGSYFDAACPGPSPARAPAGGRGGGLRQARGPWDCIETPLHAVGRHVAAGAGAVDYAAGCADVNCASDTGFAGAAAAAAAAEQVVLLLGLDEHIENEGRDREDTLLPGRQAELAARVLAAAARTGARVAVVLVNGGIVSTGALVGAPRVALVEAWYPGRQGAAAVADALFGARNHWGKLPVTVFADSFASQIKMTDMAIASAGGKLGRTYKYWRGDAPLFAFGHGLSLTEFELAWAAPAPPAPFVARGAGDNVTLAASVRNTGARAGDEVVLLFHVPLDVGGALVPLPARRLIAWRRVGGLAPGEARRVSFAVRAAQLALVDSRGDEVLLPGAHALVLSRGHGAELRLNATVRGEAPILLDTLF
eukprot:g7480.t1